MAVAAAGHTTFIGRLEDRRMTTGAGRYASDWNLHGKAYAHFLCADRVHAGIATLDLALAVAPILPPA